MATLFALTLLNINFSLAGYEEDPTGDADGINACDITQVNVDVSYHSPPVDDEVTLKIILLEAPLIDENHTIRYDYNFYVDTSLSDNSNTTDLWGLGGTDIYEYIAHLDCRWVSESWLNSSYLMCTRYYYTGGDGGTKVDGSFFWNPNTESWQASDPGLPVGEVIGNTIVWDVTSAIYREQPIGTGYVIQGVANAAYGFVVRDYATHSGWVDEFDNMCTLPTGTTTPTLPFPSIGVILSMAFLSLIIGTVQIIKRRKK